MTGAVEEIVNEIAKPLLVAVALVAVTVALYEPSKVGVPEITPVLEFKDRPVGKVPALILKLVGLLVAVIV